MNAIYDFFGNFIDIWFSGGILMWPLLVMTIFIYWTAFDMFSRLSDINSLDVSLIKKNQENSLNTSDLSPEIAKLINDILSDNPQKETMRNRLVVIKADYLPYLDRRIIFMGVLTGVAPLLGLLGTVMGMLTTFSEMGQHNANSVDIVAGGISEALITTQTGLVIAVPALFMIMLIQNKRNRLANFLNQLENFCYRYLSQPKSMELV